VEIDLTDKSLSQFERNEIEKLLKRENRDITSDLEQMWYLIDLVWDDYQCDSTSPDWDIIGKFYEHPVWLLNGLFIEQDLVSTGHRHAITNWIVTNKLSNVVDYGGGFGTLARMIAEKQTDIHVNIYEPHPSHFAISRSREFHNISIIETLGSNYDCLVSTDVLEHVPDPLDHFSEMVRSVNKNGYLVIANAFFPMIKCHLPQTFHFRYSFNIFARLMGLEVVGKLDGSHATIYKKLYDKTINWPAIRLIEKLSKALFPLINISRPVIRPMRRLVLKS